MTLFVPRAQHDSSSAAAICSKVMLGSARLDEHIQAMRVDPVFCGAGDHSCQEAPSCRDEGQEQQQC